MTTLKRTFYEMADVDPRLATIMFHAAIKRLGGTLRLSREELETYEGIETEILVEGTINEEEPDFCYVDWSTPVVQLHKTDGGL